MADDKNKRVLSILAAAKAKVQGGKPPKASLPEAGLVEPPRGAPKQDRPSGPKESDASARMTLEARPSSGLIRGSTRSAETASPEAEEGVEPVLLTNGKKQAPKEPERPTVRGPGTVQIQDDEMESWSKGFEDMSQEDQIRVLYEVCMSCLEKIGEQRDDFEDFRELMGAAFKGDEKGMDAVERRVTVQVEKAKKDPKTDKETTVAKGLILQTAKDIFVRERAYKRFEQQSNQRLAGIEADLKEIKEQLERLASAPARQKGLLGKIFGR